LPKPEGKVLFVGRIRKYKGLDFLKKAWPLVNHPNKSLTIAGVGRGVPFEQSQSIDIQNRWLTDEEIESLIDAHRLVVLPYIEASQSGIIPLAHSRGVPVVITPAGGLTGQVLHGVNGIISRSMNDYDFAEAIDTALLMEWNFEQRRDEPLKEFLDVLFELG
jgi:glycosyltransferase involved in cell wall biosynthesis